MQAPLEEKCEERSPFVIDNQGQKIFAVMHEPKALKSKPPIVIIFHGFASSKIGTNRSYVMLAEALVKEGICALRFDFRGSGDSEGHLNDMTVDDLVSDAVAVCKHLMKAGFEKIGFFGSSFGGTIALLAAEKVSKISALALWAPVASGQAWFKDWLATHQNTSNPPATYQGIKVSPAFREQFALLEVDKVAGKLPIPLLHMQGDRDETISLSHQEAFKNRRASLKEESRFIVYQETDHRLGFAKVYPEVLRETINWFKKYLSES